MAYWGKVLLCKWHCALLGIKHNSGKDDDGHGKGQEEKAQLRGTVLECVVQNPQAL